MGHRLLASLVSLSLLCLPIFAQSITVNSKILVIAESADLLTDAAAGLRGYGIPYDTALITSASATLPVLSASTTAGNYGGFIVHGDSLSAAQLQQIYAYQLAFKTRMVRYDVDPAAEFGTRAASDDSGCCNDGVEQLVSITNTTRFPYAGLKRNAGVSTMNLYHIPARISNASIATEVAQFAASGSFTGSTTAAVINNIGGREQMVWHMPFEPDWNLGSNLFMHTWVYYLTRGLFTGYRRVNLDTQVDDVHLRTNIFSPAGTTFRLRAQDMDAHKSWIATINAKMNIGSKYFPELAHNGNGNLDNATATNAQTCSPGSIVYTRSPADTALEFQKPVGSGTNVWPGTPSSYGWAATCPPLDPLEQWFSVAANRNAFSHLSHTFTHLALNNATYSDVNKEISFNRAWLDSTGISKATMFSGNGLVPPAITGLHNGDALQAWAANNITSAVGDNTRPVLLSTENEHYPLITTTAANGYAGFPIIPRWATDIYYNCDKPDCIAAQYQSIYGTANTFESIMANEKSTNVMHLLALRRDPFMFHQANLRQVDMPTISANGISGQYSLLQLWVETVVQEFVRLVSWPIITLPHDTLAAQIIARRNRDLCKPNLVYTYNAAGTAVTGATVSALANGGVCTSEIPVSFPGYVVDNKGARTEMVGGDPLTAWVNLSAGGSVSFVLSTPVAL